MSYEHNGSTPGLNNESNQLDRVNTLPSVEFTIPHDSPEFLAKCASRRSHGAAVQVAEGTSEGGGGEKDAPSVNVVESYPEGGLRAWLVVLGSFFGTMVGFGMMNIVGIFQQYLKQNQLKDYPESTIGWIFGLYVFLSFFCGIQIGPVFDRHGPRLLVLAGSVLTTLSMFLMGVCTKYWHFIIVYGILGGVGTSLLFTPGFAACSHFFYEKRGTATGIAAAGGSVGGVIFPLMLQRLFPTVGFAWATRILGFVFLFCNAIACLLIRSRLPPVSGQSVKPDFGIFRDKSYLLLTVGIYFMEWGLFVPITYISSFATSTGAFPPEFSYQILAIFNAGSCFGRWLPGHMADWLGRFNSMIACLVLCGATTVTFWLPATLISYDLNDPSTATTIKALIIVYAIIFGFASGSNISLTPVCVGQLCETNQYGRYYATCYTIVSFGTLTGIPIAGALISACGGHYWGVTVWTLLCYIVSLGCFIWSRALRVGWGLGVKF